MGKFKKGDFVLRTAGSLFTTSTGRHEAGFVGRVSDVKTRTGFDVIFFDNGHEGIATEYEPWQPRVGERVRYSNPKYGQAVVKEILLDGKFLVDTEGKYGVCTERLKSLEPILTTTTAPEQPAALKIEAGKFYKTRDGRKVGPMKAWSTGGWCSEGKFDTGLWLNDGQPKYSMTKDSPALVAEWIAEPVVDKAINDNAEPKFKVGDRVRLARSFSGVAKVGATATVDKRGMFDGYIDIVWDKNSLHQGQMDGGYSPDYFELLPPAPSAHTTIVALIENGQPKPSSTPHVHASTGAAEKEAKCLAAKHKGKQFGVFTLTTTHEEAAPVYDHKWQNLAALGLKIDAIKELRSITGMGLKPAKDAVEYFLAAA